MRGGADILPEESGGVRRHGPTPPRGPTGRSGGGAGRCPFGPGPGARRAIRRFPARCLVRGPGSSAGRCSTAGRSMAWSAVPWLLAAGQPDIRLCIGASRGGPIRSGRPMGAPPSRCALVLLPFCGTTVTGLPADGPDAGRQLPRQTCSYWGAVSNRIPRADRAQGSRRKAGEFQEYLFLSTETWIHAVLRSKPAPLYRRMVMAVEKSFTQCNTKTQDADLRIR